MSSRAIGRGEIAGVHVAEFVVGFVLVGKDEGRGGEEAEFGGVLGYAGFTGIGCGTGGVLSVGLIGEGLGGG